MTHIIVTGAGGFVGRALSAALSARGHTVTGLVRRDPGPVEVARTWVHPAPDFEGVAGAWPQDLRADCLVHLAARVHVMRERAADPEAAFRATNVEGSLRVAEAAYRHGVRRLVYVSSIKALGETDGGTPLREADRPRPEDAYGRSKCEAELALRAFGARNGLDVVIVRPPLVYGPGVRANFLSLMRAIASGLPLPVEAVVARRSLVYVGNLAHALVVCATDPGAVNGCFHVSDGEDLSVPALARAIGHHLGQPARLIPVPVPWLRAIGKIAHRGPQVDRLVGSLRVDISHLRTALGWQPRFTMSEGLAVTANWYRSTH